MRTRSFIASDNIGRPCDCLECQAAGVTQLPIVRVPADQFIGHAHWLHGDPLKRWYAARERFEQLRAALEGKR